MDFHGFYWVSLKSFVFITLHNSKRVYVTYYRQKKKTKKKLNVKKYDLLRTKKKKNAFTSVMLKVKQWKVLNVALCEQQCSINCSCIYIYIWYCQKQYDNIVKCLYNVYKSFTK